jgi:hypothetical protein
MIDLYPTCCNLCGGEVVFTSNAKIYGREYGSGKCYLCTACGGYTGTHRPRPKEALGLLADAQMRKGKVMCHSLFDPLWQGKPKAKKKRRDLYAWLAEQMEIPSEECHFGWFNLPQLRQAYKLLKLASDMEMRYDKYGKVYFVK